VVTLPSYPGREYHKVRYAKVKDLYKSLGVPFYDILEDLSAKIPKTAQQTHARQWGINPVNSHPGPAMTYWYAVLTADILEMDYRDLLGPRVGRTERAVPHINDWIPFDLDPVVLKTGAWAMEIPVAEKYMLRLPSGEPFIQLNLDMPAALRAVRVMGKGLTSANLTITSRDPERGYDDGTLHLFDRMTGTDIKWDLSGHGCAQHVNTIRLTTSFINGDRRVEVTLVPMDSEATE
jgi:hypothetical protein